MSESSKDPELLAVTGDEEQCLARVLKKLDARGEAEAPKKQISYDAELLSLRDQMSAARSEDIPPLLEQMERLQALAARQTEAEDNHVDAKSPYFGRLVLKEGERAREVLIGRGTYLDTKAGVRIVDWRDAPVSRIYYRYAEGDDYDEVFGEREVTGEVQIRRSVTISDRELRRVSCPQGNFANSRKSGWVRLGDAATKLTGGQGTATRAQGTGKLGVGDAITENEDKHLREITPLIDARQFELITHPDSGLVVIQGGAGSGKTTIGLHRIAYLAYHDERRFRPDKMLVVVFNEALVRYIGQVLPSLGLSGVAIRTYQDWAARLRASALPYLPRLYSDDAPAVVSRLKKHPAMLKLLEDRLEREAREILAEFAPCLEKDPLIEDALVTFERSGERPFLHRLHALKAWFSEHEEVFDPQLRNQLYRIVDRRLAKMDDVVGLWAEILTDLPFLRAGLKKHAEGAFTDVEIERAHSYAVKHTSAVITEVEEYREGEEEKELARSQRRRPDPDDVPENTRKPKRQPEDEEKEPREPKKSVLVEAAKSLDAEEADDDFRAVDGLDLDERATLDREDDALLLRLLQRIRGPLRKGQTTKEALVYEHVLVDEAQDLSPVEMSVIFGTVSRAQCVTLAGDTAQRLHMDNGFSDWKTVLGELGLSHVEVEPLKLSYRSTAEILEVAQHVLGPLKPEEPPQATRHGAAVELFQMSETGDCVAFLGEALRELSLTEPRASVAVVARYPEHADLYFEGLKKSDIPYLRRITDQDFPFKPGIDVTDIRQVKGLEFDYVILVEVNESGYPEEDEARHLLHIGVTRAAHQLWLLSSGKPSKLLPEELRERGY